jgi:lanthanide-dependent methanol dehydrogenase
MPPYRPGGQRLVRSTILLSQRSATTMSPRLPPLLALMPDGARLCGLLRRWWRGSTVFVGAAVLALALPLAAQQAPVPASVEDDGQWLMAAKNYANTRYSALDQINASNVKDLKPAWAFSTGVLRGHEAAPLVVGDTMYLVTPFPNILYALDLTQQGALKWSYRPEPDPAAKGVACCDVVNRGAAYADGRIYFNTLDMHTVAVDAESGKEIWKTRLGDIRMGETMTMAPLVVKGKVLVGNSGGELGVRGWLTALDAATGKIAWRAHSTGPDKDVLIGKSFKPFYAADREPDLGVKTWHPDGWRTGGGTVWGWISYDPELDLIYYGTSNPAPWNGDQRPGDNKWTASLFARRPDTGEAIWAYQWNPHDAHDYDGTNENIILTLNIGGRDRKVLVHPERNGFMYVHDAATGEVLSAEPFVFTNSIRRVNLKTGRPEIVEEKKPKQGQTVRDICPAAPGGKDWQPGAWSPRTRLLYFAHNNLCMDFEATRANYIAGTPFLGAKVTQKAGPGGHRGAFTAWDPVAARPVWQIKENFPAWSGVVATAGDVVFYGTMDRWFRAVHARTGKVLWQYRVGSGIIAQPITYRGPDGKQYVAVLSGVGGWAGAIVAGNLDPRDGTGALGMVGATRDLPDHTSQGGMLYVFELP